MRASQLVIGAIVATAFMAAQAQSIGFIEGGDSYSIPVRSQKAARFAETQHQQFDFSCGSAAVATLLTYHYGQPTTEATAFEQMFNKGDAAKIRKEGFSLLDIKRFLASRGFEADGYELPLETLEEAHVPAIVLITDNGYNHFVIVKGLRAGRVLIGDPSAGTRLLSRERFDALWKNRVLFVIHNHEDLASFNTRIDWQGTPMAPIAASFLRDSLTNLALPRLGPGDF